MAARFALAVRVDGTRRCGGDVQSRLSSISLSMRTASGESTSMPMDKPPSRLRIRRRVEGSERGRKRNVYMAASDVDLWTKAEEYADRHNISLSSLVAEALAAYLQPL